MNSKAELGDEDLESVSGGKTSEPDLYTALNLAAAGVALGATGAVGMTLFAIGFACQTYEDHAKAR